MTELTRDKVANLARHATSSGLLRVCNSWLAQDTALSRLRAVVAAKDAALDAAREAMESVKQFKIRHNLVAYESVTSVPGSEFMAPCPARLKDGAPCLCGLAEVELTLTAALAAVEKARGE